MSINGFMAAMPLKKKKKHEMLWLGEGTESTCTYGISTVYLRYICGESIFLLRYKHLYDINMNMHTLQIYMHTRDQASLLGLITKTKD